MKISFIIPFNSLTGGIKVIFTHANNLVKLGHSVTIYAPFFPYLFGSKFYSIEGMKKLVKGLTRSTIRFNRVRWFNLNANFKIIPWVSNYFIQEADIIIATSWPTAYSVYNLSGSKGVKVYLILDYEIWSGPKELVDNSYKLGLNMIGVVSGEVKRFIEDRFGVNIIDTVPNGVDDIFYLEGEKKFNYPRKILMLYHRDARKGVSVGIEALKIVKSKHPDVEIIMFGARKPRKDELPSFVRFYRGLYGEKLANLYKSVDIFVSPSLSEAWNLPPMEAMAAKCAVVATSVGSMKEIGIQNETALICKPGDVNCLVESILKLLYDEELLRKLAENGHNAVKAFTWSKSTLKLEHILESLVEKKNG
jgi:hypothetical protein